MIPKICYIKTFPTFRGPGTQRAVANKGSYWTPGETIDVCFMGGTKVEQQRVLDVLEEITQFVNIKFNVTDNRVESDVRISFTKGAGSWSYLGSQALYIPKNRPTLNIGWDDPDKSTTRHELGHMLNLFHEHQNPDAGINWDRDKVIQALSGPPNSWSISQIEHNVLRVLSKDTTDYTDFDPDSVMLYFFPAEWTTDGVGTKANATFSAADKKFLQEKYPFPDKPIEPDCPECPQLDWKDALSAIISTEKDLNRFREDQLIVIGGWLGIDAKVEDLKRDTVRKIWLAIQ